MTGTEFHNPYKVIALPRNKVIKFNNEFVDFVNKSSNGYSLSFAGKHAVKAGPQKKLPGRAQAV